MPDLPCPAQSNAKSGLGRTRYAPFRAGNTSSGVPFGVLGNKMVNETKTVWHRSTRDWTTQRGPSGLQIEHGRKRVRSGV